MDEQLNLAPILIPLAALLLGWVLGFFDSNLRSAKKIKQAQTSAEIAIKEVQEQLAAAQATPPPAPITVDDAGVLRIKDDNGALTLDLDGTRVEAAALSPAQRKRLIDLLTRMRPWLEGKPTPAPSTPAPLEQTSAKPAPAQPFASTPRATVPPPPANIIAPADRPIPPANSIVGQIDAVLQARLAGTPLASYGIFLTESPEGGVIVYVGLKKFMGLDAVPDPNVKEVIRAAIAEWENKFTPGL